MTTIARPLLFAPSARWADLPAHSRDAHGVCVFCGEGAPLWNTYEEYLEFWWTHEYEGAANHAPNEREEFEYLRDSCLG